MKAREEAGRSRVPARAGSGARPARHRPRTSAPGPAGEGPRSPTRRRRPGRVERDEPALPPDMGSVAQDPPQAVERDLEGALRLIALGVGPHERSEEHTSE